MRMALLLIANTAQALLLCIEICMLVRAVLSWFPIKEDHPLVLFVHMVTEPIVSPIRRLFDRFGWFRNSPIDVSFLAAVLLLSLLNSLLGSVAI